MSMKRRHAAMLAGRKCERCGSLGKSRQLNELLLFDRKEPVIALCDQCVRSLKSADARAWKWFRDRRDQLSQEK